MEADSEVRHARERAAYERHRAELERRHPGKIALLCGDELVGVFPTLDAAASRAFERFGPRPCLTQRVGDALRLVPLWGLPEEEPAPPPGEPPATHFAEELATYQRHRAALERDHGGEYAVIRGGELVGVFGDESQALSEGRRRFGPEKFLLMEIGDPVHFFPLATLPDSPSTERS
jgi:hypothetical protein